jgi:hypothetical protein
MSESRSAFYKLAASIFSILHQKKPHEHVLVADAKAG